MYKFIVALFLLVNTSALFADYNIRIAVYENLSELRHMILKVKVNEYIQQTIIEKRNNRYYAYAYFPNKKEAKKALKAYKKVFSDAFISIHEVYDKKVVLFSGDVKTNSATEMTIKREPKKPIPEKKLDLFGNEIKTKSMSLSNTNGVNDYFLFNDLRNGDTTIHSWDILETTKRQKDICYLLLKNRRKSAYGKLDGNPLSLKHFQSLVWDR